MCYLQINTIILHDKLLGNALLILSLYNLLPNLKCRLVHTYYASKAIRFFHWHSNMFIAYLHLNHFK